MPKLLLHQPSCNFLIAPSSVKAKNVFEITDCQLVCFLLIKLLLEISHEQSLNFAIFGLNAALTDKLLLSNNQNRQLFFVQYTINLKPP